MLLKGCPIGWLRGVFANRAQNIKYGVEKRSSCEFSEWNSEKSPMALFPLRNRWSGGVRNHDFPENQ